MQNMFLVNVSLKCKLINADQSRNYGSFIYKNISLIMPLHKTLRCVAIYPGSEAWVEISAFFFFFFFLVQSQIAVRALKRMRETYACVRKGRSTHGKHIYRSSYTVEVVVVES